MKKYFAILLAVLAVFALCACGSEAAPEDEGLSQIANPVVEVDATELQNALGVALTVPGGDDNVKYFLINGTIGEAQFDYNGASFVYRAQKTDAFEDISGVYFSKAIVIDSSLDCSVTVEEDGSAGAATWYADGFSYAICMGEGATIEALQAVYSALNP